MSAQFVLLRHDCPLDGPKPSHWDFMLEHDGVLLTWQLNELPSSWGKQLGTEEHGADDCVQAMRLGDHRLVYLDYEGPISGNRGRVTQIDRGEFSWLQHGEKQLALQLRGDQLEGTVTLTQQVEGWTLEVTPCQN